MMRRWLRGAVLLLFCSHGVAIASDADIVLVSAEGLADPEAEAYRRDKGLMADALLEDAKRQAIEKVVGSYVDSHTLVQNYTVIEDRVLTRSKGLIKRVVSQQGPWLGDDGFMHLLIQAEVFSGDVQSALKQMSEAERLSLIRERGDPKIQVAVWVRNAARGGDKEEERSQIAENLLKEEINRFGYRVWSEPEGGGSGLRKANFGISGEARFEEIRLKLPASGINVTKYKLTSWTVKCLYIPTGEEIYFNNKVPRKTTWNSEEEALEDIGRMIGAEFSKDLFERYLLRPSQVYELQVEGLPDYDTGTELKMQFVGLRSVLNVDFLSFEMGGVSLFEVEMAGTGKNFAQLLNETVLHPLNAKLKSASFSLVSVSGKLALVRLKVEDPGSVVRELKETPPASLLVSAPQRIAHVAQSEGALRKIAAFDALGKPAGTLIR